VLELCTRYRKVGHVVDACTACDVQTPPSVLQTKTAAGHRASPGNELGIFEQGSFYDASDLQKYLKAFAPWVPSKTQPKLVSVDGGKAPQSCELSDANCGEADVDIQIAIPLIYPQRVINYQVDDQYYGPREYTYNYFNTFLDALDGSYCNYTAYNITGDSPGMSSLPSMLTAPF
jgi:tripeptidyl-peptidase I